VTNILGNVHKPLHEMIVLPHSLWMEL